MIWTLQRGSPPAEIVKILAALDDADRESTRIRCPHCAWQPRKSDLWSCVDLDHPEYFHSACGTSWNTFATRGQCPGCAHQWRWTSCIACGEWSLHETWYVKDSDPRPM